MKYNIISIIIIVFPLLFISCENDISNSVQKNTGFLEIQYDYQLNGVNKLGFRRVNISNAFFKLHVVNDLDQSLIDLGFRKVELYLASPEFKTDSLLNPLSQPLGTSFAHISLVDSLGKDANPNRMLPYSYTMTSLASFSTTKKNSCVGFDNYLSRDTLNNVPVYNYSYTGQLAKSVNIVKLGSDRYQIIANGLYNSKIYNLYYIGEIKQESDLK